MKSDGVGGVIGELTLVDATLSALLADMRAAMTEPHGPVAHATTANTTGTLADQLLSIRKDHRAIVTDDMRDWLKRVKRSAEQRNAVVHATGRDRCMKCGKSSEFEHKGEPVDRSAERIGQLIAETDDLIRAGVQMARDLSARLSQRLVDQAKEKVRQTGEPQALTTKMVAGALHRCAACSDSGQAESVVTAPPAVIVVPPGIELRIPVHVQDEWSAAQLTDDQRGT